MIETLPLSRILFLAFSLTPRRAGSLPCCIAAKSTCLRCDAQYGGRRSGTASGLERRQCSNKTKLRCVHPETAATKPLVSCVKTTAMFPQAPSALPQAATKPALGSGERRERRPPGCAAEVHRCD